MTVQGLQGRLKFDRKAKWIELLVITSTLFRHAFANMFPEITELGHVPLGNVVCYRNAGKFHNAALDGMLAELPPSVGPEALLKRFRTNVPEAAAAHWKATLAGWVHQALPRPLTPPSQPTT